MTEAQVLEVLAACAAQGLPVWVDGGWAVDAVLGRQTRPHDDLDLAARVEDGPALEALMAGLGLVRQGGRCRLEPRLQGWRGPERRPAPLSPGRGGAWGDGPARSGCGLSGGVL